MAGAAAAGVTLLYATTTFMLPHETVLPSALSSLVLGDPEVLTRPGIAVVKRPPYA